MIKLKEEEHRRQKSKFWAKITNAPDVSAGELKEALLEGEHNVREVKATDGGFLVSTPSEEALCALEGLTGHLLGDRAVKVARTQIRMTGDEILSWMDEKLRIQDEARECVSLHDRGMAKNPYYLQDPKAQGFPVQVYQTSIPSPAKRPEEAHPPQKEKGANSAATQAPAAGPGNAGGRGKIQAEAPSAPSPEPSKGRNRGGGDSKVTFEPPVPKYNPQWRGDGKGSSNYQN